MNHFCFNSARTWEVNHTVDGVEEVHRSRHADAGFRYFNFNTSRADNYDRDFFFLPLQMQKGTTLTFTLRAYGLYDVTAS